MNGDYTERKVWSSSILHQRDCFLLSAFLPGFLFSFLHTVISLSSVSSFDRHGAVFYSNFVCFLGG